MFGVQIRAGVKSGVGGGGGRCVDQSNEYIIVIGAVKSHVLSTIMIQLKNRLFCGTKLTKTEKVLGQKNQSKKKKKLRL